MNLSTKVGSSPIIYTHRELDEARAVIAAARAQGRKVMIVVVGNKDAKGVEWHHTFAEEIRHAREKGFAILYVSTKADASALQN